MSKQLDILEKLNIADSFTLAMDDEIRREGLPGSLCGFVLELNKTPDIETLQLRINDFGQQFPLAFASLQQRGKHFYWCKRETSPSLFHQHYCPENQTNNQFQQQIITQLINDKQDRESISAIEFHLIISKTAATFFTRWIHPFCDARGIDLILQYLCTKEPEQRKKFGLPKTKPLVNIQLDKYRWWQKISLLFKAKRYIARLDNLQSIQAFNIDKAPQQLNYTAQRLTEAQTEQVIKQTRKQVGLTGTSLYYIGCLMRALDKMNPTAEGDAYCVPYAFNLRKQRALSPITSNHVCALFAQAPRDIIRDREKLFPYLKKQNMDVIRQKLDYAFLPLMWAGTWLSLEEYGKVLRLSSSSKERSSFWFSDIGSVDIQNNSFLDAEVKGIFHLCQVTTAPAFAFLSCIFQNQLTLSYNFVEPLINSEQIETLHQLIVAELLDENE